MKPYSASSDNTSMKYLIINADDLGYDQGTVDAIIEGARAGIFTSASIMPTMPFYRYALERLKEVPRLGIGVHLSFNQGSPVLPPEKIPTLCGPDGTFNSHDRFMKDPAAVSANELRAEFRAQVEKVLADGIPVTHIDNHYEFIYMRPDWFDAAIDTAMSYGLPMRCPFDDGYEKKVSSLARFTGLPEEAVLNFGVAMRKRFDSRGIARPNFFEQDFTLTRRTKEYLLSFLTSLNEGVTELLTHPGLDDPWREVEYALWMDGEVRAALGKVPRLVLCDYRKVSAATTRG